MNENRNERARESYEALHYPGSPIELSRPSHLATSAWLHGLEPTAVSEARVLEIGCSDGGNLVPLAAAHRTTEFVGIDIAPSHIDAAQAHAARLGIANVAFRCLDLTRIDDSLGEFDYIIAHGVLSWVPAAVRERLLSMCAERLSGNGIAYISYNTYPGWYFREGVRSLLLANTDAAAPLAERAGQAQEFLRFLGEHVINDDDGYSDSIRSVVSTAAGARALHYLAHEYLADELHPFYFREFVDLAERHGLGYVADSYLSGTATENLPAPEQQALTRFGDDPISVQQCMDYLRGRCFRRSLLCRAPRARTAAIDADRIRGTWLATKGKWEPTAIDPTDGVTAEFRSAKGEAIRLKDTIPKRVLLHLRESYPRWQTYEELIGSAGDAPETTEILKRLYIAGLVDIDVAPPVFASEMPDRPRASRLVRELAPDHPRTVSLRHQPIAIDDADARRVLALMDGTRTRDEILAELAPPMDAADLDVHFGRLLEYGLLEPA